MDTLRDRESDRESYGTTFTAWSINNNRGDPHGYASAVSIDFLDEPFGAEDRSEHGPQHFDRDLAAVFQVLGEVDRCHAARAKFPLDGVPVGEGGFEAVDEIWHCVLASLARVLEYMFWS